MPAPRTKTRRRKAASEARKSLARYQDLIGMEDTIQDGGTTQKVISLLWAQARIEQALALETGGNLGDLYATPGRILERTKDARAEGD